MGAGGEKPAATVLVDGYFMAHEEVVHHAKQQLSILYRLLFDKKNDIAARLLHEMGDLETLEGLSLIRGIALVGIDNSLPFA